MTRTVTAGSRSLTVLEGADARNVLRLAESAHLPEHFTEIINQLEDLLGQPLVWKPFGGEGRVAHSALGSAAESTHLLGEPVMNFLDAALEMMYLLQVQQGDRYMPHSMAEAATRWFAVPTGGLPAWDTRSGEAKARYEALARKSQLLIRHGSKPNTPTAVFLDSWLGQHPADHEDTILSIQKGLKAEIPFLAGQYGHGAGFTLAFSNGGQILIGRRHPDLLEPGYGDLVGLSLVVRKKPSETNSVNPTYWYAVAPETEAPLAFSPEALGDPRWHGLRRTCINYEMRRYSERDIYFALDHNISNPALPYAFRDERTDQGDRRQFRFMSGNAARLQRIYEDRGGRPGRQAIRVPHRRISHIDLDAWIGDGNSYGTIEVTTTFVKQEGTGKGNELYAPAKEAESWTLNGQRHHARNRLHFGQDPIRLESIRDSLLVEVKLDKLTPDAKALILTTDRQGAAEREARFQIEAAIDDTLATDTELRTLNDAERDTAVQKALQSSMKDLDRELVQFGHFVRTEKVKVRVKKQKTIQIKKQPAPKIQLPPIAPLHAHPTFLRFRKQFREVLHVAPGKTTSVLLEADAVDGYFNDTRQPSFQFNPPTGMALTVFCLDDLADGRMRVRIKAATTAALGATKLIATYLPPSANAPLTTAIDVVIALAKPRKQGTGTRTQTVDVWETEEQEREAPPPYEILYEDRDPKWADHHMGHWTTDTVGEYKNSVAYVNGDYASFGRLLRDVPTNQHQEYVSLYAAPVIMTIVGLAAEEADPPKDDDGKAIDLPEAYRTAMLETAALSSIFTIRKLRKLKLMTGEAGDETATD
jgi:hypothetical protein